MRIGIMLRHLDQHGGGVLVYTRNLLRELLSLRTSHEFVLLYRNPALVGSYANGHRIRELAVEAPFTLMWDQWAVRRAARTEKLDLIFNPKFSVPLRANCRTVFVLHGLDWYVMPWGSKWLDRISHKFLIPRYAHAADAIITISNTVREHVIEYLKVNEDRVHPIYYGVDESFRQPVPPERLKDIRHTYQLPERFFLYCGQVYPPKNFGRLLQAYARVGPELGISLVVAGEHRWLSNDEVALINQLSISQWVVWSGWIDRDTIPAFYALAEALLLPSLYEGFGLPIVEAMACGTPVITADRYAPRELADQAGILVNPESVDSIAAGMRQLASDPTLRQRLVEAGHKRAQNFSWKKCAQETLHVLEHVLEQN